MLGKWVFIAVVFCCCCGGIQLLCCYFINVGGWGRTVESVLNVGPEFRDARKSGAGAVPLKSAPQMLRKKKMRPRFSDTKKRRKLVFIAQSDDDDVEFNVLGCRVAILGTNCDQCVCMVECCFTSTETIRLIRTGSPGRPPRL